MLDLRLREWRTAHWPDRSQSSPGVVRVYNQLGPLEIADAPFSFADHGIWRSRAFIPSSTRLVRRLLKHTFERVRQTPLARLADTRRIWLTPILAFTAYFISIRGDEKWCIIHAYMLHRLCYLVLPSEQPSLPF